MPMEAEGKIYSQVKTKVEGTNKKYNTYQGARQNKEKFLKNTEITGSPKTYPRQKQQKSRQTV